MSNANICGRFPCSKKVEKHCSRLSAWLVQHKSAHRNSFQ